MLFSVNQYYYDVKQKDFKVKSIQAKEWKTYRGMYLALHRHADKLFGKGNWHKRINRDNSLNNPLGWYAVINEETGDREGETLMVELKNKPEFIW